MNPDFSRERVLKSIHQFGYAHVDRETDMEALQEFAQNNGLAVEDVGAMCTVTLVPAGQCASRFDWDAYRKERDEKNRKKAERKKKKELTK